MGEGSLELAEQFSSKSGAGWQTTTIGLSCFVEQGTDMSAVTEPLVITSDDRLKLQIGSVSLVADSGNADCNL
jgi:hypothetical protein